MHRMVCMLLVGFAGACLGADWPQFLGPTRNASAPADTKLLTDWPAKGPTLAWEKAVGQGYSSPIVVGDLVVLFHRVGDEDVVEALELATGKPRWKFAYATDYVDGLGKGNGPRSTPASDGKYLYTLSAQGLLHCLDLQGKKVWARDLGKDYPPARPAFFGIGTSPLLEANKLLVNIGGKEAGIVALDAATGKTVWQATTHETSYASPVAATIENERHVLFFTREGLVSLDPADGKVRFSKPWRARLHASVNAASPTVVGDRVFISACYDTGAIVYKIDKTGPTEVWRSLEAMNCHYTTCVQHAGLLFGIDGRQEEGARLRCLDWQTGKVRWSQDGILCGSLLLADKHLLSLSEDGVLSLIAAQPEACKIVARAQVLGKGCRAQMALAKGLLLARDDQKLICVQVGQ